MSKFASRENTRAEQHTIHRELESLLGAVEVTGLSGWERTRKIYGGTPEQRDEFDHVWYWRSRLPERKGQRCRVLARGAMNSILVGFEDGTQTLTSRYAVRGTGLAEGEETRASESEHGPRKTTPTLSPSASPIQDPLFEEAA